MTSRHTRSAPPVLAPAIFGDLIVPSTTFLGCWAALRAGRQTRAFVTAVLSAALSIGGVIAVAAWGGARFFFAYGVLGSALLLNACASVIARALVMWVPRVHLRFSIAAA